MRLCLFFGLFLFLCGCGHKEYKQLDGKIYGTYYHVVYQHDRNLDKELVERMERVDASLSMFNKASTLSKINNNEAIAVDSLFLNVFEIAREVYLETGGAFDITVGPLVNAWGFGYKQDKLPSREKVDSLLQYTGMDKLHVTDGRLVKQYRETELDAGAVAKGFGVDQVAVFFEANGINNYLVEIGGEVRAKGASDKNRPWRVGIDKPDDSPSLERRELQFTLSFAEGALATSGNYRNFYLHEGRKYAHTIDPRSGYPVQREILSATVLAPSCAVADAYATAFMVLGLEESIRIVENNRMIEGCFIYSGEGGVEVWMSDGFRELVLN